MDNVWTPWYLLLLWLQLQDLHQVDKKGPSLITNILTRLENFIGRVFFQPTKQILLSWCHNTCHHFSSSFLVNCNTFLSCFGWNWLSCRVSRADDGGTFWNSSWCLGLEGIYWISRGEYIVYWSLMHEKECDYGWNQAFLKKNLLRCIIYILENRTICWL